MLDISSVCVFMYVIMLGRVENDVNDDLDGGFIGMGNFSSSNLTGDEKYDNNNNQNQFDPLDRLEYPPDESKYPKSAKVKEKQKAKLEG